MQRVENFIGGDFRPARSGATIANYEPATGVEAGAIPDSDARDIDDAVAAADAAFAAWSSASAVERSRLMLALADEIERDLDRFAAAESDDTGKPIALARSVDIPRSAANLRFFATAILHGTGEFHEFDGAGTPGGLHAINYTLRRPRGVAACISPWNLPLYLLTWKIAPALAAGNTVVAKPSEVTPVTAHLLADAARRVGFPPGVLNIVHGRGPSAGAPLVEHPRVPTITFTGSTGVGRWIGQIAGHSLKRVSLELGGKNPLLIFPDADLDDAIATACRAAFTNQGQICLCGSRVLVHGSVYERVAKGLADHARVLTAGDPRDPATRFGAIVSEAHLRKIDSMVSAARDLGGRILAGGSRVAPDELPARCRGGYFFRPTVIDGLDPACAVEREEIFGPVVTLQRFTTEDDAISIANSTDYGLAATVFTRDVATAHRVADRLHAGIVWVNCWMVRDLRTPFGGVKNSGVGREGGVEALKFFTEPKNVCVRV